MNVPSHLRRAHAGGCLHVVRRICTHRQQAHAHPRHTMKQPHADILTHQEEVTGIGPPGLTDRNCGLAHYKGWASLN